MHSLTRACTCLIRGARLTPWSLKPRTTSKLVHRTSLSTSTTRPNVLLAHCAPFPQRTHNCGGLSEEDDGKQVVLAGWLLGGRKVGKAFYFFPLKDSHGTIQLVVSSDSDSQTLSAMRQIPPESTVLVQGTVRKRPESQKRAQPGGDIEVSVQSVTLLNPADENLPFAPSDTRNLPAEDYRLRYRYLDLRRTSLSENIRKRSDVAYITRTTLHDHGFAEVETPILLKSTPEGAREFLVPTRVSSSASSTSNSPSFYALPQSPQQPKQLLIASGAVERYYQIAKCFRDEDGRKDRQPEFTQIDLEMAWVSWGDHQSDSVAKDGWRIGGREVREVIETLICRIWEKVEGVKLPSSFKVITYAEAMGRWGSDKPDTRFGFELQNATDKLPSLTQGELNKNGEIIEALVLSPEERQAIRGKENKAIVEEAVKDGICFFRSDGAPGGKIRGRDALLTSISPDHISNALDLQEGSEVWLARRTCIPEGGSTRLGRLRLALLNEAQSLGRLEVPTEPHFLWITEFPLFTKADTDKDFLARGRWSSSHHPFTAPMWEDVGKMYAGEIAEVRGQHYDLVLNGTEIGGGSVRVHDAAMQDYIFKKILKLDERERNSFDHLLHALRCGAPPHGGIALGFDRLMAILCKAESIRDVIAFPKTGAGTDLLFKSPAASSDETLRMYGMRPEHSDH